MSIRSNNFNISFFTTADTTPNPFSFTDVTGVATSSLQTSNSITVGGINAASSISVTGGTYSINGGPFTAINGTVVNGNTVRAQHTASGLTGTNTNTTVTIGGVSDTFTSTTSGAPAIPTHIQNAAAGNWTALSGTLRGVAAPIPPTWTSPSYQNVGGIMWAWSGAAYNYTTHQMLFHGGGHVDYDGNEIYAFKMDTNAWVRLTDPSPRNDNGGANPPTNGVNPDGSPQTIHTYGALGVSPLTGKLYRFLAGGTTSATVKIWTPQGTIPAAAGAGWSVGPTLTNVNNGVGGHACYDPVGNKFYINCLTGSFSGQLVIYDPTNDTFTIPPGSIAPDGYFYYLACAVDPVRRLMVRLGGQSNPFPGRPNIYNITTGAITISQVTTGPQPNLESGNLVFDTRRNIFWGMVSASNGSGQSLYSLDPATWAWTAYTPGGVTPISGRANQASPWGIFTKFAYCQEYDVLIHCPTVDAPMYLYKPSNWQP